MKVGSPDGATWRVGRRWLPWQPRRRGRPWDELAFLDFADVGSLTVGLAVFLLTVAVIVLFPFIVLALELLLLVLVIPIHFAVRMLLGKPWTVYARRTPPGRLLTWRVPGWRRAGEVAQEVAAALERGQSDIRPADAEPGLTSG